MESLSPIQRFGGGREGGEGMGVLEDIKISPTSGVLTQMGSLKLFSFSEGGGGGMDSKLS